jgi:ribosomal-protein-alanine N-acetyltransferase
LNVPAPVRVEDRPDPEAVREATGADIAALAALEQRCFAADAWSESMLREELHRPGGVLLVAQTPAAGFVCGWWVADELHLLRIAVAPEQRRKGLASALHRALFAAARGRASVAWLEVRADNEAAIGLYRGHGWEFVGRRPRYYADASDALVFRRTPRADGL